MNIFKLKLKPNIFFLKIFYSGAATNLNFIAAGDNVEFTDEFCRLGWPVKYFSRFAATFKGKIM
jgi:hypothetical protein